MANRPLKPQVPGETPDATTPDAPAPKAAKAAAPPVKLPSANTPAHLLPDQDEIDTDMIPFGQTRMSKQGIVCSTALDPRTQRQLDALKWLK